MSGLKYKIFRMGNAPVGSGPDVMMELSADYMDQDGMERGERVQIVTRDGRGVFRIFYIEGGVSEAFMGDLKSLVGWLERYFRRVGDAEIRVSWTEAGLKVMQVAGRSRSGGEVFGGMKVGAKILSAMGIEPRYAARRRAEIYGGVKPIGEVL